MLRHDNFQSGAFDLGLYDQTIYQYANLLTPFNTVKQRIILGDHLNLTLILLAPLFYIWENVRILLLFQSFIVVLSFLAIYKISLWRGFSKFQSLFLTIIYSLFYGFQFLIYFDFHPIAIGVSLLPWFIYALEKRYLKFLVLLLILIILTQENMGLALVSLGIIYLFYKKNRKISLLLIVGGFLQSILAVKIISFFSPLGYEYQPQINFDLINFLLDFVNSEEKRQVWLYSFSWFSFLPLFSPGAVLAVLLDLSQYFLTGSEFSRMWSPYMHHRAILAIFLFLGLLEVLHFFKKRKLNLTLIISLLLFFSLFLQYYFHFPLNKLAKKSYWQKESWMDDNYKLINSLPKNYSLASQQNLVPHLTHRTKIYLIYPRKHLFLKNSPCGEDYCWWLDFGGKPDYLVVDLRPNQWITQLLESTENFSSAISNMEKMKKIRLIKAVNNAKLYKINY